MTVPEFQCFMKDFQVWNVVILYSLMAEDYDHWLWLTELSRSILHSTGIFISFKLNADYCQRIMVNQSGCQNVAASNFSPLWKMFKCEKW